MKFKKIIKGIVGIGVVSGVAYLAYKIGECSGEINEKVHAMADVEDDDEIMESDEEDYDFYDNLSYDEPDDGCIAPHEDYRINEWDKFITDGYDENCDNGDHFFTRLRNIDSEGFSINDIMRAAFAVTGCESVTARRLRDEMGISLSEAEHLLSIFEAAGYVSERDTHNSRKVYISDMTLDDLV